MTDSNERTPADVPLGAIEMTFCMPHFKQISQALKDKGLWQLVPKNGEDAAKRMQGQAGDPKNFDPLMYCLMEILMAAIDVAGPQKGCPIEIAWKAHTDLVPDCADCDGKLETIAERWIEGASNEALLMAKDYGLLGNN